MTDPTTGATSPEPLLRLRDLVVHLPVRDRRLARHRHQVVHAVDGVSLDIRPGEILGLVGESGSGKSTLARAITRRVPITAGSIVFDGQDITQSAGRELRRVRRSVQMVFQDPYSSLNPKMQVGAIIAEPLVVHGLAGDRTAVERRVAELLELVGLDADAASRYPHAFSGGQRQRIGIARAIAVEPKLVIADEPVSALDVSIQAQILHLLAELRDRLGLAYLFIAHNLAVVRSISDRIAVMYAGQVVEVNQAERLCAEPAHPYTRALLSAAPTPDPDVEASRRVIPLAGEVPSPIDPPAGCRFHTRCPIAEARCKVDAPDLSATTSGGTVACWFPLAGDRSTRVPSAT